MAEETAGLISGPDPDQDPTERRLLAAMPLHAITSVHGQAGLRERLLMGIDRFGVADRDRARDALALASHQHRGRLGSHMHAHHRPQGNHGPPTAATKSADALCFPTLPHRDRQGKPGPARSLERVWRGRSSRLMMGHQDSPGSLTRNSHAFTTPPARLATVAGISQYKPPPALTSKVIPATPTSTAVIVLGENLST